MDGMDDGGSGEDTSELDSMLESISEGLFERDSSESDETELDLDEGTDDGEDEVDAKVDGDDKTETDDKTAAKPDGGEGSITTSQAPNTWKKEVAAEWGNVPESVRQEVLRREEEIHQGIEGYRVAAQVGDTFYNVAKDYTQNIQARGIQPLDMVKSFFEVENKLATGNNDQKVEVLQQLANEYGIILDGNGNYSFQDASVMELKQQVQALTARESERLSQMDTARRTQISNEIESFAKDPANEHFNVIGNDMAVLIKANPSMSLKDAYDKATWMNPTTRAIEVARENGLRMKESEARRKEEVAKAKKLSGVNLAKSKDASSSKRAKNWEDDLGNAYDEIQARH